MNNKQIYQKDPSITKLVNEGVANVNDEHTEQALSVLRYELETFVCDGQYEKGLEHILEIYINNIEQAQQSAVWVSGFYGSGKSHLVKMLRALWLDTKFSDGAKARGIADLPRNIQDLLKELSTMGKRHGGLHAASGTLGASASGSVRLALLNIIFKSVGLPNQYPIARFVMWLKSEEIYDKVRQEVENNDLDWQEELDNFYVAEGLHSALVKVKPNLFLSSTDCVATLNNLYPSVQDISNDAMLKAIRQALTKEGKFPLTLIALDEIQQFIGEDSRRSNDVQEVVETCCKNIGGKLLFIGTGQTAVTGTANLKKLEGRFTIRIELSDADVDAVIRKVILAKKPNAIGNIEKVMQENLGEISRHLTNSSIGHRQDDIQYFAQDYPILPVRRRFWENTLRVLDQTGTDSQLRNQLSMVHKVIQTNLENPIGNVIPADFLYFDLTDKLLQARVLPRKVHEKTNEWFKGSPDEKLVARACGLVFLINKLAGSNNEIGINASLDTIADLLVEDLTEGSSALRNKLQDLLDNCKLLMKVGDDYRIQTEESTVWNDEFLSQRSQLANEAHRVEAERNDRIRQTFSVLVKKLSCAQGKSKVTRDLFPIFDSSLPSDKDKKVYVWIRDGWSIDEKSVRVDARQAGNQSSTIFVFIPKRSADDFRHSLIDFKAATATLNKRGLPISPEGKEAYAAMKTTVQIAETKLKELLTESFAGARVFQGGGNEILGNSIQDMIMEATKNALQRLYPQFNTADHSEWDKVYTKAKQGSPDALKAIGYDGKIEDNPVCRTILGMIAGGKNGNDIRTHFENAPFGWSRDAIDGGVQVLMIPGLLRAENDRGQSVDFKDVERKAIGKTTFKVESTTVTVAQRIKIRGILQKMNIQVKQNKELTVVPEFLEKMLQLAESAGGDPPKPEKPDIVFLKEIRLLSGNEKLLAIYNSGNEISRVIKDWRDISSRIEKRLPSWNKLKRLSVHADGVNDAEVIITQINNIESERQLLEQTDLIAPLIITLTQLLREEINDLSTKFENNWEIGETLLVSDKNWNQLEQEQRYKLRFNQQLIDAYKPMINVESTDDIINTLNLLPLSAFKDRVAALPARFDQVKLGAAKLLEPEVQEVSLPYRTLKTEEEVDQWLKDVEIILKDKIKKGPVYVSS